MAVKVGPGRGKWKTFGPCKHCTEKQNDGGDCAARVLRFDLFEIFRGKSGWSQQWSQNPEDPKVCKNDNAQPWPALTTEGQTNQKQVAFPTRCHESNNNSSWINLMAIMTPLTRMAPLDGAGIPQRSCRLNPDIRDWRHPGKPRRSMPPVNFQASRSSPTNSQSTLQ